LHENCVERRNGHWGGRGDQNKKKALASGKLELFDKGDRKGHGEAVAKKEGKKKKLLTMD